MSSSTIGVSVRAEAALKPGLPYFAAFANAKQRPWTPNDPLGNVILTVAENKLTTDLLQARLQELQQFPLDVFNYASDMCGLMEFREVLAKLMMRTFLKGLDVSPNHVLVSCGAGAVLENLFFILLNPGEGVLIPAPYYPAFDQDLTVKDRLVPTPVHLDCDVNVIPQLEAAAHEATAKGHPIKALLLASPNNPLGTTYKRDTLVQMLQWCLKNDIHLVSDEIYALSVFGDGAKHHSTLVVAEQEAADLQGAEKIPQLVHCVWGMSKDFASSGLRMGVLYTRHPLLLQAYSNIAYFTTTCNYTQWAFAQLLADEAFVDRFLHENRARLRRSYSLLAEGLAAAGIPFIPCDSAMFCWLDLRAALKEDSWEGERVLWGRMVEEYRLLLTPGETCHSKVPGFFRACYAWMPPEAVTEGTRRLKLILKGEPLREDK